MNARITLSPDVTDLVFTYEGGEYVEIWFSDPANQDHTGQVINVFNYATGRPQIAFTPKGVERAVIKWLKEQDFDLGN